MPSNILTFRLDRQAETSPKRLAILIGAGGALLLVAIWMFSGDEPEAPVSPPAPLVAPAPPASTLSAVAAPAQPTVASSGLELHGVMGNGAAGAAILSVAGVQRLVRVGREVSPGIALQAIAADHVVLVERGATVRLGFPGSTIVAGSPTPPAPGANGSAASGAQREALESRIGMAQRRVAGRVGGFVIRRGATPSALAAAGLRSGDVVLSVGGTILESEDDLDRIPREMRGTGEVQIEFIRDGRVRRVAVNRR